MNNTAIDKKVSFDFINNVKTFAVFSVIAVHFRLNVIDKIPAASFGMKSSLFFSIVYQLFISCVPLFILATGFLMLNKTYTKVYLKNIAKIYSLYVLCSLFSYFILLKGRNLEFGPHQIYLKILNFNLIGYSWYVEMYLGLVLLIPIVNKMIQAASKKEMQGFILAMTLVVSLPQLINSVPQLVNIIHLPAFWGNLYPVLYYLIGAYIRQYVTEKTFNQKAKIWVVTALAVVVLGGIAFNMLNAHPQSVGGYEGGYPSLSILIQSVLIFLVIQIFLNRKLPFASLIAKVTLPIYLMSFSVDNLVYPFLIDYLGSASALLIYAPIIVLGIFIISLLLGLVVNKVNKQVWCFFERKLTKVSND